MMGEKPSFASIVARAPTQGDAPVTSTTKHAVSNENGPAIIGGAAPTESPQADIENSMAKLDIRAAVPTPQKLSEQARSQSRQVWSHEGHDKLSLQELQASKDPDPGSLSNMEKKALLPLGTDKSVIGSTSSTLENGSRSNIKETLHVEIRPESAQEANESEANGNILGAQIATGQKANSNIDLPDPDEKLLEALETPKDRIFVLRLEQDIVDFVKRPRDTSMNVPPCNSFCRLLAHKLADYYALGHFGGSMQYAVTLYKTPYCQIRTPLLEYAKALGNDSSPATQPTPPLMKIMRRPEIQRSTDTPSPNSGTTPSSTIPSKATSEQSDESRRDTATTSPTEPNISRDKAALTRAEREARYKEKRDEIFGPQHEFSEEITSANSLDESRSSSRNEDQNRKKKFQNRFADDDFEARSQFNAFYPPMPFVPAPYEQHQFPTPYYPGYTPTDGPTLHQPPFHDPSYMRQGMHIPFQQVPNSYHSHPTHPINAVNSNSNSNMNYQAGMYNHSTQTDPTFTSTHGISPNASYPSYPPHHRPDQAWSQAPYNTHPQQAVSQRPPQNPYYSPNMPYDFGQLPLQSPAHSGNLLHPVPGSYSRHGLFNLSNQPFTPQRDGNSTMQHAKTGDQYASMGTSPAPFSNGDNRLQSNSQHQTHLPSSPANVPHPTNGNRSLIPASASAVPSQSSLSKWSSLAVLPRKPPSPENTPKPESTSNQSNGTTPHAAATGPKSQSTPGQNEHHVDA